MNVLAMTTKAAAVLLIGLSSLAPIGSDLRITDSKGTQVTVTGAMIDYGGILSMDREPDGIRVLQGDGLVTLKWLNVDSLRVTKVDETARPIRLDLDVVLRTHKHISAVLLEKGDMQLIGKTEAGDYLIDLNKVRLIVPVR